MHSLSLLLALTFSCCISPWPIFLLMLDIFRPRWLSLKVASRPTVKTLEHLLLVLYVHFPWKHILVNICLGVWDTTLLYTVMQWFSCLRSKLQPDSPALFFPRGKWADITHVEEIAAWACPDAISKLLLSLLAMHCVRLCLCEHVFVDVFECFCSSDPSTPVVRTGIDRWGHAFAKYLPVIKSRSAVM